MVNYIGKVFILLAFFMLTGGMLQAQRLSPKQIKKIENATFTTLDGDKVSVSDFKGQLLLMDFWETWCKPCLQSFPHIQKVKEEYPERITILAINTGWADKPSDARKFAQNHNYDFTYALDKNNLLKTLGVRGIPYKIFIDPQGNFITSKLGRLSNEYEKIVRILKKHTDSK